MAGSSTIRGRPVKVSLHAIVTRQKLGSGSNLNPTLIKSQQTGLSSELLWFSVFFVPQTPNSDLKVVKLGYMNHLAGFFGCHPQKYRLPYAVVTNFLAALMPSIPNAEFSS